MRHFEEGQALRFSTEVDLGDRNSSHTQLVLMTGEGKRVLEVGPATGYMTKVLHDRGCKVVGLEVDPAAARLAEPYAERMIVGDIESMDLTEVLGDDRFDVVIFGDVLEHLLHPERVLEDTAEFLRPGGYVVASIPNITHGAIRLSLLAGQFRYTSEGLLDYTHVHLFDRQEVQSLFAESGYEILEESRTELDVFDTEVQLRESAFPEHLVDTIRQMPESLTYQFVVKAQPVAKSSGGRRGPWFRPDTLAELPPLALDPTLSRLEAQLAESRHRLDSIETIYGRTTRTAGYRLAEGFRGWVEHWAPWGTRRRSLVMAPARAVRRVMEDGWGPVLLHLAQPWRWIPRLWRRSLPDIERLTPTERYALWLGVEVLSRPRLRAMRRRAARLSYRPRISVIVPVHDTEPEWLRAAVDSVRGQVYPEWELCLADDRSTREETIQVLRELEAKDARVRVVFLEQNRGIAGASNAALAVATGEFVGFLDHDDELKPNALYEVAAALNEQRDLDVLYSDEDKRDLDGWLVEPSFKPDWSPDLLLSTNYVNHFSVYRKELVDAVGGLREGYDGSQDHDLALRVTELTDRIHHIQLPVYTWRKAPGSAATAVELKPQAYKAGRRAIEDALERRGLRGMVEDGLVAGHHRVRYEIEDQPAVAIIAAAPDDAATLRRCVESVSSHSTYANVELSVVGVPGSVDVRALPWSAPVVPPAAGKGRAAMLNAAARQTDAELVLFLDGDLTVLSTGWIEAMLEHAQRGEVAAVGARILHADGRPQHEGMAVGPRADDVAPVHFHQYLSLGDTIRDCSAVSADAMLIRSQVLWELGGFDEGYERGLADIDLCLRAREKGYRIIYTPFAVLRRAGDTRSHPPSAQDRALFDRRWGGHRDPYLSRHLDLERPHDLRMGMECEEGR